MRIPTRLLARQIGRTFLLLAAAVAAAGQDSPAPDQLQSPAAGSEPPAAQTAPATAPLLEFKDSDVKFALRDLMDIVKDNRHEGWVLVAYPDPKTRRPLIGAGFSLDLPEREKARSIVAGSGAIAESVLVARSYAEEAASAAHSGPSPLLADALTRLAHSMVDGLPTT